MELVVGRAAVSAHEARDRRGAVRTWLTALAILVALMVAVGGATRLTGSGLSITEWAPVTGAVPPIGDTAWQTEFDKYRGSSQYRNLNRGMELGEFKRIYAWEWGHRQLGRLIGLVFFLPLAWFWFTGAVGSRFAATLLGLGALGGLQAMVGWIMVASGLEPGMIAVAPLKLMLHLVIAAAILAILVWLADGLRAGREVIGPRSRRAAASIDPPPQEDDGILAADARPLGATLLLGLVILQIALGGLVAGSRSGLTYNTWPLMDGRLVPAVGDLFVMRPWPDNLVANPALVQLDHRLIAYGLVAFALGYAILWRWRAPGSPAARRAAWIAGLTLTQGALGIVTVLLAVPLWAGLGHQLLAMALLAAATVHLRRSREEGLSPARRP